MSDNKKAMTKRELIKVISNETNLRPDVVKSVIDCFTDVFIAEVVANGKFQLSNCFTVDTKTRKARRQFNIHKNIYEEFPEIKVLSIKLSRKINYYHRWKQRNEYNSKKGLSPSDWNSRNVENEN